MRLKRQLKQFLIFILSFFVLPIGIASSHTEESRIQLFATPDSNKIIKELQANAVLVPIYRKGFWCKVGDPKTGEVGWVNTQQVEKARRIFYRSNIQTVFIHSSRDPQGKPKLSVVAYVNGEQVSQEEARRLYQQIREEQLKQAQRSRRIFQNLDEEFVHNFRLLDEMQPVFTVPSVEMLLPPIKERTGGKQNAHPPAPATTTNANTNSTGR